MHILRVVYNDGRSIAGLRKRMGSGDPPGLQNRRSASSMSMVRSTRTRFRHIFSVTCKLPHITAE